MRLRLFIALMTAALAYTITVLIGLLSGYPLRQIFISGLISLLLFGIISWITVYAIQHLSTNYHIEGKASPEQEMAAQKAEEKEEAGDNFKPLNPPILEVKEDRGEDNR